MSNIFQKAYVHPSNQVVIVCPMCDFSKEISVKQFNQRKNQIRIKCRCEHRFTLILEFRRSYRKTTNIPGICELTLQEKKHEEVTIINLSISGVGIQIAKPEHFTVGDKGHVKFTLPDKQNTAIKKQIIIRAISKEAIHCEFIDDQVYNRELGFFLRI